MADATQTVAKNRMLSQGGHEIRNLVAPIIGYVRMLLTSERLGPLTETQRKLLGEVVAISGKIAKLGESMSDLALLVAGGAKFKRGRVELRPLLDGEVPGIIALEERETAIRVIDEAPGAAVNSDPEWLRRACRALLYGHWREVSTSDELCVALDHATLDDRPAVRITFAATNAIDELRKLAPADLSPFVEYRGGVGYGLAIASEVILADGGQLFSKTAQPDPRSPVPIVYGSVVLLPAA